MKVSSTDGIIETPQKMTSPLPFTGRQSTPSPYATKQLQRMERCHLYFKHRNEAFADMRTMLLTPEQSFEASDLLKNIKSECIVKFQDIENAARDSKQFSSFIETFLSEQLCIPKKLGFVSYILFQYLYFHNLNVDDAFYDLFCLYSSDILCEECEKVKNGAVNVEAHNQNILQAILSEDVPDDSFDDPEYEISESESSYLTVHSSDSEHVLLCESEKMCSDIDEFINPFVDLDNDVFISKSVSCNMEKKKVVVEKVLAHSTPQKDSGSDTNTVCKYCRKDFYKKSNLNTHLGR